MRLLLLTPEFSGFGGGIGTLYRALTRELRSLGVDVHVIEGSGVRAENNSSVRMEYGVRVETLENSRLVSWEKHFSAFSATPNLRRHMAAAWAMWEQVDYGRDADIVEAVDWGLSFVPAVVEATRPVVVQCHGSVGQIADHDSLVGDAIENIIVHLIERDILSAAASVQTYSRANAKFWQAETGREVASIPPAWASLHEIAGSGASASASGVVVGRLQKWKGPHVVCESLRRLGERAPRIDWFGRNTIWGTRNGSSAAHMASNFPDVWNKRFFHYPQISPSEVATRQSEALFNLVPSTWDVFNFTAIEAMASGRPAIVSTGAGASELIDDGINGFLFANGDAEALASAIDKVMNEPPARIGEIGRAAQETIRTVLNPRSIATKRLEGYRAAIDAFKSHPPPPIGGWLGAICRPSAPTGDDLTFLENLPLRALASHVFARTSRRLRSR